MSVPLEILPHTRVAVAEALRRLARECEASGCIFITEAWVVTHLPPTPAELDAFRKEWSGRFDKHAERVEVVQMHLEHLSGTELWTAPIKRDDKKKNAKPTLGEWSRVMTTQEEDATLEGNFARFLPRHPRKSSN